MRLGLRRWLTARVAAFLQQPVGHYERRGWNDLRRLKGAVRKGDVVLVEGDQRVSQVIKYLTQSSWSHAALYIGDELLRRGGLQRDRAVETFGEHDAQHLIVEALFDGVVVSRLAKYADYNIRLCRPHRLRADHLATILEEAIAAIGWRYDLRNILDLARHLAMVTLLPGRYRRRVLRLGSDTSTEVICTSLLGQLFHNVHFPVLPSVTFPDGAQGLEHPRRSLRSLLARDRRPYRALFRRRHPTLLTPRDFDLSPYFEIVKFNLIEQRNFDYQRIEWEDDPPDEVVA